MYREMNLYQLTPLVVVFAMLFAACTPAPASVTPADPTATTAPAAEPAAAAEPASGMRTFTVVPEESKASYLVDEQFLESALEKLGIQAGDVDVVGSTQQIEGQLQLNLEELSAPLGENRFSVNLTGLSTDQRRRDGWIQDKGPQFSKFPSAEFTATAIEGAPDSYQEGQEVTFTLSGDLTIRDISQPVSFDVTASLDGDTLDGIATTRLLMSDFGITPPNFAGTLTVADEFGIEIQLTAREK
ncbi:MAG: YceI family protein [Chloroflexota bacterium]|nr:YceI family protein [Chloroflexota bacterium]